MPWLQLIVTLSSTLTVRDRFSVHLGVVVVGDVLGLVEAGRVVEVLLRFDGKPLVSAGVADGNLVLSRRRRATKSY